MVSIILGNSFLMLSKEKEHHLEEVSVGDADTDIDATYDHIVKYTGLFGGVQGITMLISVVKTKVAASFLGPSGIALVNMYTKVMNLVNQTTNLGISFSAIKHIAELSETDDCVRVKELVDIVRLWSLMTAVLGMFACLALSPWISLWTFGNYEYTMTFCVLSLVVAIMAIIGGEMAILKGLKQLKKVAIISVLATLAALCVCAPCYFLFGVGGVVPALLLTNAIVLFIHIYYTSKVVPWKTSLFSVKHICLGVPMAKLGVAYILAGMLGQGADYFINASIRHMGGLESVGFYNTGYFLAISIGSLLFTAIEADFFPRLSIIANDAKRMNVAVNRQIEVCVLLITPCLILEVLVMPIMVRVLYTTEFAQAAPMAVCAAFYLFFKSLTLPVAYLALAKGDSRNYLLVELLYDLFVAMLIPWAFSKYGLIGAGWALSLASVFDFILIHLYYGKKYRFRLSLKPIPTYLVQLMLLLVCVYAAMQSVVWIRWTFGGSALCMSLYISFRVLHRETDIVERLLRKLNFKRRNDE